MNKYKTKQNKTPNLQLIVIGSYYCNLRALFRTPDNLAIMVGLYAHYISKPCHLTYMHHHIPRVCQNVLTVTNKVHNLRLSRLLNALNSFATGLVRRLQGE